MGIPSGPGKFQRNLSPSQLLNVPVGRRFGECFRTRRPDRCGSAARLRLAPGGAARSPPLHGRARNRWIRTSDSLGQMDHADDWGIASDEPRYSRNSVTAEIHISSMASAPFCVGLCNGRTAQASDAAATANATDRRVASGRQKGPAGSSATACCGSSCCGHDSNLQFADLLQYPSARSPISQSQPRMSISINHTSHEHKILRAASP